MEESRHIVAIVGGAVAGAEMAGMLAEHGVTTVVFEQNPRPFGKIEDGLPRWHVKLRHKEYETINSHLGRPQVHFVPNTRIGRDIDFEELARRWGFSMVVLAHGAWRDRELPIDGADDYVGRGLTYQNAFIYWFNHYEESTYEGPRFEVRDGTIVVGGGLASIDVAKALQIELARRALRERGIDESVEQVELDGVVQTLARHGLDWHRLGIEPATIFYRRRIEDMPLLEMPEGADAERRAKVEATRKRLVDKAIEKFRFAVRPLRRPADLVVEAGRLVGLRFQHTQVAGNRIVDVEGRLEEARGAAVISSIGSIPEPLAGIPLRGETYDYVDWELGMLRGYDNVFSVGNAVTGRGNILVSRRHSIETATLLIEQFLGVGPCGNHDGEEEMLATCSERSSAVRERVAAWLETQPDLEPAAIQAVLARVRTRQRAVGYDGNYRAWIERVTPPDMA